MTEIKFYTSEKGLFVNFTGYGKSYKINWKDIIPTHAKNWFFVPDEKELNSFQALRPEEKINFRWVLINPDSEIAKKLNLPKELSSEDACEHRDDGYPSFGEGSEYYEVKSMYHRICDRILPVHVDTEFTPIFLGYIQSEWTNNPITDTYTLITNGSWNEKEEIVNLSDITNYYEIEKMLFSDLLIHNRPCYLSSDQTYRLVRSWIKNNIDTKVAVIISDYDFCFNVKKKIAIKPYTTNCEIKKENGKSYNKPKFKNQTITHKDVDIFEMAPKPYNNYTVIQGFKGKNLEDLSQTIKDYLKELMLVINEEVMECEHCNGTGHVLQCKYDINKMGDRQ